VSLFFYHNPALRLRSLRLRNCDGAGGAVLETNIVISALGAGRGKICHLCDLRCGKVCGHIHFISFSGVDDRALLLTDKTRFCISDLCETEDWRMACNAGRTDWRV
jgi:hypothetical protein